MKITKLVLCACMVFLMVGCASLLLAQTEMASLSGRVTDPQGAVVPSVVIEVIENDKNIKTTTQTNGEGLYYLPSLHPGSYRVVVSKEGFKQIIQPDVVLHVQDVLTLNFGLQLGSVSETINVEGGAPLINTQTAAVSTVIDRNFVESLPLNGRSFNTLLQLTPGVVIAPTIGGVARGQFSVAGQRTDANNFNVDGVSADFGVTPGFVIGQSGTGTAQAFSALGGTSGLVSVEALQEFRVETSSFAPEFGRSPGGQIILTTRSGTADFHGGVYEYFRNDVLDANDWFANQDGLQRAAERHNDFGGFFGGPVVKGKTFFFLSYEGARLRLPQTLLVQVPSEYARSFAASNAPEVAPFLNAYPQPDDKTITPGVYTSRFTGSFSKTATLDAGSIRIDHTFNERFSVFGRYSEAPSDIAGNAYALSMLQTIAVNTRTLTTGVNMALNNELENTLRGNYSTQSSVLRNTFDSFGGADPIQPSLVLGSLPATGNIAEFQINDTSLVSSGPIGNNRTKQFNFVDDLSYAMGSHQLKFGADYRRIFLDAVPAAYVSELVAPSVKSFLSTGTGSLVVEIERPAQIVSQSLSMYGQDTWKMTPRITLTYGLRWGLSPAPSGRGATTLSAWGNTDTPSQLVLAPPGTKLWGTTYSDFAPRIGVAYALNRGGNFVLRAGWGIFYDLGVGQAASLASAFPNVFTSSSRGVAVPISDLTPYLPSTLVQPPYSGTIYGFSSGLKLPRSYQWNVALEKSFGSHDVLSITYVGQTARDLLRQEALFQPNSDFAGEFLLTTNQAHSNYSALQLQYRRPLAARLQVLLNYTWSHSLDNVSNDVLAGLSNTVISAANDYASSDFDVRQSFSGAITYALPSVTKPAFLSGLTSGWTLSSVLVIRTGFPFNANVFSTSPDPGGFVTSRPDLVSGQPLWISDTMAPGGQSLNPAAFSIPSTIRQGTEGRNDIPGFGLTQVDFSLERKFSLTERLNLTFRADAFNLLNHPNFTNPPAYPEFGTAYLQSFTMLNQGLGGLNPLFQQGGPRSLQLSLRLTF